MPDTSGPNDGSVTGRGTQVVGQAGNLAARAGAEHEHEHDRRARLRVPLPAGGRAELTGREWETLELVRAGRPTSSVARRLGIIEVTVRRHVSEAVRKLRVRDRRAALELLDQDHAQRPGRRAPSQDGS